MPTATGDMGSSGSHIKLLEYEMDRIFADPYDQLPAYEREIVRLRAYELTLVLYYKEDIQRSIIDKIECHDHWKAKLEPSFQQRAPEGAKRRLDKALKAMVSDGAISEDERKKIVKVFNFRNDVGHRIDHLFSDLEQGRFSGRVANEDFRKIAKIQEFDHLAVQNMKQIQVVLDRVCRTHYSVGTFSWRGHLLFSSTEKTLSMEIRRSRKKLRSFAIERKKHVEQLNKELKRGFRLLNKFRESRYFDIRFDQGKMTARGQEFCYRLFEEGLSDLAIAHVFAMRLRSIQSRRKAWRKVGGLDRSQRDWEEIPAVLTPSRFDD